MDKLITCLGCGEERSHHARGLCQQWYIKEYHKYNPDQLRKNKLKYNYNITPSEYNRILGAQSGVCVICGKTPEENGRRLAVDHNHATGEVRGLLCTNCNLMLGNAKDNPVSLSRAADYILSNL